MPSACFSLHTLPVFPPADKRFCSQSQFHPVLFPLLIYFGSTRMAHFLFLTFPHPFLLLMVFKAQSVFHNAFNCMIGQWFSVKEQRNNPEHGPVYRPSFPCPSRAPRGHFNSLMVCFLSVETGLSRCVTGLPSSVCSPRGGVFLPSAWSVKLSEVQTVGAAPSFFLLNARSVHMHLALRSLAPVAGYLGCFHLLAVMNDIDQ